MKANHLCGTVAVLCIGVLAVVPTLCAQEVTAAKHIGAPQDWSQRQIVFSKSGLAKHPEVMNREPRVLQQAMQRWQTPDWGNFQTAESISAPPIHGLKRDWVVTGLGGHLDENAFPAKYSFDPGAPPDCTNDYVVFGLNVAGVTGGQANLVAFNNLYSGAPIIGICGTAPTVLFAYNVTTVTGGKILTSPVLSLDGTQIAFVESVPGSPASAIFHVLTWTAGAGSIGNAAAPSSMTSVAFSTAAGDTTSAPWIDYTNDIAYVGADDGNIYQITGAFTSTPAVSGSPWPVLTRFPYAAAPPVLDSTRGLLMVGSSDGKLYQITTSTGAIANVLIGSGTNSGIYAPPIVDVTNGTTFVVTGDSATLTGPVLVQVNTSTLSIMATGQLGMGSTGKLFQPAFSNGYFTSPVDGEASLCGTGASDTTPWQYEFGFNGSGTMQSTPAASQQLLVSTAAQCTGWTEFYNPNINGGTDFFFFGLTQDCDGSGAGGGCVAEIVDNTGGLSSTFGAVAGPSGIVVDNYSTAQQASSIYYTPLGQSFAYKLTQNGLN